LCVLSSPNLLAPPFPLPLLPFLPPPVIEGNRPPANWPSEGRVEVVNLVVRYRPELEPVLHGLTFTVNAMEKVRKGGGEGCVGEGRMNLEVGEKGRGREGESGK
jgi:ATP-binding cassette subfamily C (CFTR/MRP) protein 1